MALMLELALHLTCHRTALSGIALNFVVILKLVGRWETERYPVQSDGSSGSEFEDPGVKGDICIILPHFRLY